MAIFRFEGYGPAIQPGEVTVVTVEDRVAAVTAAQEARVAADEAALSLGSTIASAEIKDGRLILTQVNGVEFDAGPVSTALAELAAANADQSAINAGKAATAANLSKNEASQLVLSVSNIASGTVVGARVAGDDLLLMKKNGEEFVAGKVRGLPGPAGPNTVPTNDAVLGILNAELPSRVAPVVSAYLAENPPGASGPDIVWNGDSLSAQGGSTGQNPAGYLNTYITQTVRTNAVGGERASGIAARQGGVPYLLSPVVGSIPSAGPVVVTIASAGGDVSWPLLQVNGNTALGKVFVGKIRLPNGVFVQGTVELVQPSGPSAAHQADDYYTFTRTVAGVTIPVTRPAPFYSDFAFERRGDLHIIQAGRNDMVTSAETDVQVPVNRVLAHVAAMVEYLEAAGLRYLILGVHNGTAEGSGTLVYQKVIALNAALGVRYGRKFLDFRPYFVKYAMEDVGATPTTDDLADVAADRVPRVLMTDGLHLQLVTRQVLAKLVRDRLVELGWATIAGSAPTLPATVTDVVATPGSGTMALAWAAPVNGGSALIDYIVQYKVDSASTWTTWPHAASVVRTASITGLTDNTPYTFRVAAQNGVGTGSFSAPVTATPVPPFVPITDDFNRGDSTSLGALWQTPHLYAIESNHLTRAAAGSGTPATLILAPELGSADHEVSMTINRGTSTSVGPMVRVGDSANFYNARVNGTGNLLIIRVLAGVTTALIGSDGLGFVDGATLKLRVVGQVLTLWLNGAQVLTYTDANTSLASNKRGGIRCDSTGATKPAIDNFAALSL